MTPQQDEQTGQQEPDEHTQVIIQALSNFARGTQSLIRHHITLAKHEIKADAAEIAKDAAGIAIASGLLLMGYVLLLGAAVLFSAWFGGIIAAAITTFVLALIHLTGGAILARGVAQKLGLRGYGLTYTSAEIQRSTTWAKQIANETSLRIEKDNSNTTDPPSPRKPA